MKLSMPVAVLVGICAAGAMISLAVVFTRRGEASTAASSSPQEAPASGPTPSVTASASAAPSTPAPAPTADTSAAARAASKALDAQKPAIGKTCWEPSVKKQPKPDHVDFIVNFTFDARGQQIARGLVEGKTSHPSPAEIFGRDGGGAASRTDVTRCLATAIQPITIDPPGASVYVEVPFTLP